MGLETTTRNHGAMVPKAVLLGLSNLWEPWAQDSFLGTMATIFLHVSV